MIDIEKNYIEFKQELKDTQRDGIDNLIFWLDNSTDFKDAPASTKYHLHVEGGLTQHSLNVLKFARLINKEIEANLIDSNLVIASLLHDLCKANFYVKGEEWDKEWKDKTNQWRKKEVWKTEDQLPLGHGEKSVILAHRYIGLADSEMLAIRWHMLKWDVSDAAKFTMSDAMEKEPLVKVVAMADQMAEMYESLGEKGETGQ